MKTILISIFLLLCMTCMSQQKVNKDSTGNYTAVSTVKAKSSDKATGKYFTDSKGIKYPVYISVNNKLYYWKVSAKTGNKYKVYITVK